MTDPPWEPPLAGTDVEHLVGTLERLRATFRWKADGLDVDQLRLRAVPTSELTVGGLLKHLAVVEDDVFSWRMAGQQPVSMTAVPEDDLARWQFTVDPDETAEGVYALWEGAVGRSRATLSALLADGGLDQPGHLEFGDARPTVRRHLHDLVEEYGRHTGHMDLLREAIDGRVGEDPPADWPMLPAVSGDAP
ncbi:DUF664 domain-containing protein [Cellulosimicrobium sp. NPDC057127]|uniref:mycothiol transferase n=1 Tax=Cellulosimicrobium sp. NPDC057127 TaxID=3346026 RepID=UPI00363C4A76